MSDVPGHQATILTADPGAGYRAHAGAIDAAVARVLRSGWYVLGKEGAAFEEEFSAYQEGGYTVGVANGTEALELALQALGVGPGDRVATVGNTVTATVTAIRATGAEPVYVEIDDATMLMDPAALAAVLATTRVKVVVPVHLYGQAADMPVIMALARAHGAAVLEDCAQAHGARGAGRLAGTWGAVAAFSFYPTKNLGALGDGGAVFTRDAALAEELRARRQYGWRERYVATGPGRNSRLDELQAAILRVKLPHLDAENARRREIAGRYLAAWGETGLTLPVTAAGREQVFHQFTVRHAARDAWVRALRERGVVAGVLYPVPVYRQAAHARDDVTLAVTEAACAGVFSVPVHPGLSNADVARVIAAVQEGVV